MHRFNKENNTLKAYTLKKQTTLHFFSFHVRIYRTFIGEYFGWCKYGATGVDPGFRSLPHRINLKLYYVSGQAIVRIISMFPVEDSSRICVLVYIITMHILIAM
jgi:hypothetical protein